MTANANCCLQGRTRLLASPMTWRTSWHRNSTSRSHLSRCSRRRHSALNMRRSARGAASWATWSTAYATHYTHCSPPAERYHLRFASSVKSVTFKYWCELCVQTATLGMGPIVQFDTSRATVIQYTKSYLTVHELRACCRLTLSTCLHTHKFRKHS